MRLFLLLFVCLIHGSVSAAPLLVQVIGVKGDALVVERDGAPVEVKLAGVEITDIAAAEQLLLWTVGSGWVMLEPDPRAGSDAVYVYRSPDALFVNRELVERGYANATLPGVQRPYTVMVRYLGEISDGRTPLATVLADRLEPRSRTRPGKSARRATSRAKK